MSNGNNNVNYHEYLALDELLSIQRPLSRKSTIGDDSQAQNQEPMHDETLFIIVHQVYELWFKQILFELEDVMRILALEYVHEHKLSTIVARFDRILAIQNLLVKQITVVETITPMDFLSFRDVLRPASGFQSIQFRLFEIKLGLQKDKVKLDKKPEHVSFREAFGNDKSTQKYDESIGESDLFDLIIKWLEQIPFLDFRGFDFLTLYKQVRKELMINEYKNLGMPVLEDKINDYISDFDEEGYNLRKQKENLRLTFKARNAALFINLYRNEPILQLPYQLLTQLVRIDEQLVMWRYRHALMVSKMLGRKLGTGGSQGYDYLSETVSKNKIYTELANIASELIPPSYLPSLTSELRRNLEFYFTHIKAERGRFSPEFKI